MKVECIAESILQYFWPALSDNWSWKPIFGLCESGHFTQVLLYASNLTNNCATTLKERLYRYAISTKISWTDSYMLFQAQIFSIVSPINLHLNGFLDINFESSSIIVLAIFL